MSPLLQKRFIGACLFAAAFLALMAVMYFAPHALLGVDARAALLVKPLQTLSTIELFIAITTLGSATGIAVFACALAFYLRTDQEDIVRLVALLAASALSMEGVKMLIGRIRPPALPWLGALHSYSFPSGHATLSMALFGFMAVIAYARSRSVPARTFAILIPAILILLIGASRIILAAHYFSDVIAGYFLGGFWLMLLFSFPRSAFSLKRGASKKAVH